MLSVAMKQLLQVEASITVITQSVGLDIFQEIACKLVRVSEFKKVLNAIEPFVVIKHEGVLVLFVFRHIPQPLHRIVSPEEAGRETLNSQGSVLCNRIHGSISYQRWNC